MRIALTGDSIATRRGLTADPAAAPLYDLLRGADAAFTNIEVVPCGFRGDPSFENDGSHLAAEPGVLDDLLGAGFSLFTAANNHILDYGIAGLRLTMQEMDRRGMCHAGLGDTLETARMPAYLDVPAGSVALLACCSTFPKGKEAGAQRPDMQGRPGLNPLRYDTVHEVTAAQLDALKGIADSLGLEAQRREKIQLGFGFPPADPAIFHFQGQSYRAAEAPAIRTAALQRDVEGIAKWVREARGRADLVVLSLHAHEQGATMEDPAEFIPPFCRRMIEEGADIVVGHGPHLLRGMELHRGRPIFYSLGNFVGQNELTQKLPADSYDLFRVPQESTPGAMYRQRHDDDRKGFPADRRFWEAVVPICRFDDGRLVEVEIHPIVLGHGLKPHRRGRPKLAPGADARAILDRFALLSQPFGTAMEIGEGIARLRIPA
ncbi:CapA family protein [Falsiroseomonas sp.]|uniref:CapA family protein n=1 Tax=Falsiroseomonas sp. TaxID=2870721 RepID=UPI00356594BE